MGRHSSERSSRRHRRDDERRDGHDAVDSPKNNQPRKPRDRDEPVDRKRSRSEPEEEGDDGRRRRHRHRREKEQDRRHDHEEEERKDPKRHKKHHDRRHSDHRREEGNDDDRKSRKHRKREDDASEEDRKTRKHRRREQDSDEDRKSRKHRKKHRRREEEDDDDDHSRSRKKDKKKKKERSERSTSKPDKRSFIPMGNPLGKPPANLLDPEADYFAYHEHLWVYMYRERGLAFNDMTSEETREAFRHFVELYNKGDLPEGYYVEKLPAAVLEESKTTKHSWSFRMSESEGRSLQSIEAGVRKQTEYRDPSADPGSQKDAIAGHGDGSAGLARDNVARKSLDNP